MGTVTVTRLGWLQLCLWGMEAGGDSLVFSMTRVLPSTSPETEFHKTCRDKICLKAPKAVRGSGQRGGAAWRQGNQGHPQHLLLPKCPIAPNKVLLSPKQSCSAHGHPEIHGTTRMWPRG